MTRYYKVTAEDGSAYHGGTGKWREGRWRSVKGPLVACENGLHLCRADQLIHWLGPVIWGVEVDGEVIDAGDKVVARRARVIRRVEAWNERTARIFGTDRAEDVLHLIPDPVSRLTCEVAIYVARCYADGEATDEELDAARAAAGAAAWAAWAARAAWAAAGAAAWAAWAARAARAAWAAAGDAAWAAAWDAARAAQSKRLIALLGLEDAA